MKRRFIFILLVSWLVVVSTGLAALWKYAETPGTPAAAPETWPQASRLSRTTRTPTLVMFAHPKCACTRASLGELAILMTHVQHKVTTHVVFLRPSSGDASWDDSDLERSAAAIPGLAVVRDENGMEAAEFGAAVSGQALLYGTDGRLVFSGGITDARGHQGDNAGRSALMALLADGKSAIERTPVFGCPLQEPLQ